MTDRSSPRPSPTPATAGTPDVCPDCGLAHRVHAWNCPRVAFATVPIVPCSIGGAPLRDETPEPATIQSEPTDADDANWHEEAAKHYDKKAEAFERANPYTEPELNPFANTARGHRRAGEVLRALSRSSPAVASPGASPSDETTEAAGALAKAAAT